MFLAGLPFLLSVYLSYVTVFMWQVALWAAVVTNATGTLIATVCLLSRNRGRVGVWRHALGLACNVTALATAGLLLHMIHRI